MMSKKTLQTLGLSLIVLMWLTMASIFFLGGLTSGNWKTGADLVISWMPAFVTVMGVGSVLFVIANRN